MNYSIIFFPGMIFHELSHLIACLLVGVKVKKVKFFGLSEAYVVHEKANALKSVIITLAPFILGNAIAFYFLSFSFRLLFFSDISGFFFLWLGLSFLYYCFPSDHDASNTFNAFKEFYSNNLVKGNLIVKLLLVISIPFVFFPLFIILGLLILFNFSRLIRLFWVVFIFALVFNEPIAFEILDFFAFLFNGIGTFLFG